MSESALLSFFVLNDQLRSTCDFNPYQLQNGKQVYEVIRIIEGKPLFMREHLNRFFKSAAISGISLPVNDKDLIVRIKALIEANRLVNGNIEFLVHIDTYGEKRFVAMVIPYFYPTGEMYKNGVKVSVMEAVRKYPNAKAYNRNLRDKADKIIKEKDVYEVILKNDKGYLTEGSRSNIFFISKDSTVHTPPLSLVLPGITRMKIFDICSKNRINIIEENITLRHTEEFNSFFITGTSPKVLPVKSLDGIGFNTDNKLLRNIKLWYDNEINGCVNNFDFEKV